MRRSTTVLLAAACFCGWLSACDTGNLPGGPTGALTNSAGTLDGNGSSLDGDDSRHLDGSGHLELKALLSGADSARAKVEYEEKPNETKFEVEVVGGIADATLDVAIDGTPVGSVALDAFGNGKIEFTTTPHEDHHDPLPPDFPTPVEGSVVTVGGMSGPLVLEQ